MSLKDILAERRSSLSKSSITTYNSILTNLYKKIFGEGEIHLNNFEETDKIIDFLKDISPNKRKTILSALVVLTDNKKYRELMLEDISSYNKDMSHQEKSETQKENWLSEEEINATYDRLKKEADYLYKKPTLTMGDLQIIQDYIILCLLGGKYIPVRRSLDYVNMKKSGQLVKDKDNYIDWKKNEMIFNIFKTAKYYGKQELTIPSDLKRILNKWAKQSPHTDFLLFDNNSNPLTSVKLNQRFEKIFGKKASVNLLRHSYLTKLYGHHIEESKKMDNTATNMGTSSHMIKDIYIKK
jgi:hypothetical protein